MSTNPKPKDLPKRIWVTWTADVHTSAGVRDVGLEWNKGTFRAAQWETKAEYRLVQRKKARK